VCKKTGHQAASLATLLVRGSQKRQWPKRINANPCGSSTKYISQLLSTASDDKAGLDDASGVLRVFEVHSSADIVR